MALLDTYGPSNRVISQDLMVTYSKTKTFQPYTYVSGTGEITINSEWEYHRYASKVYSYVGMTKTAANNCAAAMITKYTRTFKVSAWNSSGSSAGSFTDDDGGSQVMAQIAVIHNDGCMYSVQISVTEDDARTRTTSVSPASLFANENARDYDTANS